MVVSIGGLGAGRIAYWLEGCGLHDYILIVSQLYVCLVMLCGCRPPGFLECAVGAVSEQCGEETAERMRALGERVVLNIGCAGQSRKRLYSCF